ncbi:hypothetical protein ACFC3F_14500 [Microbacterium sp. NPDC055910]|uniref:hypothetical protein n=1 Tax=Microbacterium sp. NPDC055910 TaxID=3345659 RepID=UPI0035DA7047
MTRTTRALSALGTAVLAAGLLAGCATGTPGGDVSAPVGSAPSADVDLATDIEVDAAWLDGGRMIGIVTQGSSTCVPTAEEATFANGVIDVTFVEPDAGTPCTRDLVPRVTLVATPEGVDPTQDVDIRVTGESYVGDADLDGEAGLVVGGETDYLPSAGWTDEDGLFVILTWGSSTCVPVLETVAASGPAEVTATFAEPEADQPCTMDMAPRGTVAYVDDLDEDDDISLVLQGGEFDNVRIPIIGSD